MNLPEPKSSGHRDLTWEINLTLPKCDTRRETSFNLGRSALRETLSTTDNNKNYLDEMVLR